MSHMRTLTNLTIATMMIGLLMSGTKFVEADKVAPTTDGSTPNRPHGMHHHHNHGGLTRDAANLLGMERQDLLKEWQQGKTLVQIAQARKGWDEATFTQKLSDIEFKKIDDAIKSGKLSKEQGEIIKKKLPEKMKNALNHKHGNHHDRMPGTFSHL